MLLTIQPVIEKRGTPVDRDFAINIYRALNATPNIEDTTTVFYQEDRRKAGSPFKWVVNAPYDSTTAVSATATFTITGGTAAGGNQVTQITVNGQNTMSAPVLWVTSNAATATAVAAGINTNGYTASAVGAVVTITAPSSLGATVNTLLPVVTVGGDVTVGSITAFTGGVTGVTGVADELTGYVPGYSIVYPIIEFDGKEVSRDQLLSVDNISYCLADPDDPDITVIYYEWINKFELVKIKVEQPLADFVDDINDLLP